jgi:hypothetical protein
VLVETADALTAAVQRALPRAQILRRGSIVMARGRYGSVFWRPGGTRSAWRAPASERRLRIAVRYESMRPKFCLIPGVYVDDVHGLWCRPEFDVLNRLASIILFWPRAETSGPRGARATASSQLASALNLRR